eukprot:UN11312
MFESSRFIASKLEKCPNHLDLSLANVLRLRR